MKQSERSTELNCDICGAATARLVREVREREIGRRRVRVEDEFFRCDACGEAFFTAEQAAESDRRAGLALREQHGVLLPEEIRALRERVGLTQYQFEDLLGVGRNTVVRWENGQTWPNAATNTLLRLLDADPQNARRLAEWHRVDLGSAA